MLRITIIGCGKIADSHVAQILRIRGCEIVGVCDREELMTKQLRDRYPVGKCFTDIDEMIDATQPDIVHITTPPQSHLSIGLRCLERGCHVLVEKPFTVDLPEAEILIGKANAVGRKLTVGHDAQFSDVANRLRTKVRQGALGDHLVHMESTWCYNLADVTYAKTLLANREHWARKLPGGLLHNIISHGLAKVVEFLVSERPTVIAQGFVSPFLRALGEERLVDELRVIIRDPNGPTAYFTFSSQMQPAINQFRVYGSRSGFLLDEDQRLLIRLSGDRFKSYAEHFVPPVLFAKEYLGNAAHNLYQFIRSEAHMDYGKKYLFEAFYKSIQEDAPMPIPYREILLTARIMDDVFAQLKARGLNTAPGEE